MCPDQCSGHGTYNAETSTCTCDQSWTGPDCSSEVCEVVCGSHGVCYGGVCRCEEGWTGTVCDQKACHPLCSKNGVCKEGKCECDQGWTGEHCNIAHNPDIRVKGIVLFSLLLLITCFLSSSLLPLPFSPCEAVAASVVILFTYLLRTYF
ncbi:teneurin-3-like [Etheostoma spectabile]|uniref:teneurin-3-like n=1 Tax=Etheostoma spectabile TaxID=54343 RepID=UPI0013AF63F1|nr:teneurin-3-like [Etheostoma spectabile]